MLWRVEVKDIKRLGNVEVKDRNGSVKQRLWKDVLQRVEVKERKGYLKQRLRKEKVIKSSGQGKKKLVECCERRFFNISEFIV